MNDENLNEENLDDNTESTQPKSSKRKNLKPKLIGKHSLQYDTIYKGKKTFERDENEPEHIIKNAGGSLDINEDVLDDESTKSDIDYFRSVRLKKEIYKLLSNFTDLDFHANRRKPSKSDFNSYYALLLKDLTQYGYTKTEIFIELSGYFSDNTWNMFKILDNKFSKIIIDELKDKYGIDENIEKINFL